MHSLKRRLALFAVGLLALLALPASALATSTPEQIATATKEGVKYLKTLQAENGSIPGFGGDWSLTSFAAAGTAAADLHYKNESKYTDARTFYKNEYGLSTWPGGASPAVTEFERAALVSYAAGIDPARVSPQQNLLARIVAQYQTENPGYYGSTFNGTVFAVLALAGSKTQGGVERFPQSLLNKSVTAMKANQHTDGGWTWEKAAGNETALKRPSEPDLTGATMAALCGAGVAKTNTTIVKAKEYLVGLLESSTGGFKSEFGINTDSNAWAVQGLNACGISAQGTEFTTAAGKTPIDFLRSQQLESGAFKYLPSESSANEYSSQDAVRALAGAGFTAAPPTPTSGEKWLAATEWESGVAAPLALVIEYGTTLKVCSVSVAPSGGTTTLAKVLETAVAGTTPTGCVANFSAATGTNAINQINSYPSPAASKWEISIDGGALSQAKSTTTIHLGDTIYLQYE
jgi:hypothetical protein